MNETKTKPFCENNIKLFLQSIFLVEVESDLLIWWAHFVLCRHPSSDLVSRFGSVNGQNNK